MINQNLSQMKFKLTIFTFLIFLVLLSVQSKPLPSDLQNNDKFVTKWVFGKGMTSVKNPYYKEPKYANLVNCIPRKKWTRPSASQEFDPKEALNLAKSRQSRMAHVYKDMTNKLTNQV